MKKLLIVLVLFVGINTFSQEKSKVQKVDEIEVYILAEPVREYESVKSSGKGIQWGSFASGGLINESIATRVNKYIKQLAKEYKDENIEFDAIIYTDGKHMTAVKFTDEKTDENDRIAIVQKIEGIPFFVMSEPLNEYELVETIGGGIKLRSAASMGLVNNSIEQDLKKFTKKMTKKYKKNEISAIIYVQEKEAKAIKFTE